MVGIPQMSISYGNHDLPTAIDEAQNCFYVLCRCLPYSAICLHLYFFVSTVKVIVDLLIIPYPDIYATAF